MPIRVRKKLRPKENPNPLGMTSTKQLFAPTQVIKPENLFLPDEINKKLPIFSQLYNLCESNIPCGGHLLTMASICYASMATDESRQVNLAIGAVVGEGKTLILSQMALLPYVNFFTRTTFSEYVLTRCGSYLIKLGTAVPLGIKLIPKPGGKTIDKSGAKDRIKFYFDIVTEGEGIFTTSSVGKLLQLWNALIEQGWWTGGDSYNGTYKIGDITYPIKHGLIIAATLKDFERHILRDVGWSSRMVLIKYACTARENKFIREGQRLDKIPSKPNIMHQVLSLLTHINPRTPVRITYSSDEVARKMEHVELPIMLARKEHTGKRATLDAKRLAKGMALLNGRNHIILEDIIVLKSLLTMSLTVKRRDTLGSLGTRLHFLVTLGLSLWRDVDRTRQFIKSRFLDWGGKYPLYTDEEIERAISDVLHAEGVVRSVGKRV